MNAAIVGLACRASTGQVLSLDAVDTLHIWRAVADPDDAPVDETVLTVTGCHDMVHTCCNDAEFVTRVTENNRE
jgi:hypothetical protein